MLSHSKILLMRKVGIFGVLASSMMLLFGRNLLLYPSGRRDMRHRRVSMSCQPLMIIFHFMICQLLYHIGILHNLRPLVLMQKGGC